MSEDDTRHVSRTQHTIYRCTECGAHSLSIGKLHAHIERHRGFLGLQLPWRVGDADELMEMTEIVVVEESETFSAGDEAREYVDQFEVTKIV